MIDLLTAAIGEKQYLPFWSFDFLHSKLGSRGTCMRYYFNRKLLVDIGDPKDYISRQKSKILQAAGFKYVCIPPATKIEYLQAFFPLKP